MGARHDFVSRYAALTASDEAAVRHRVQTFIRGGVGPERREPLHNSAMATWLLGLLASDTHIEAIETAERFAKFPCIGAGVKPETKEAQAAFDELFPNLRALPLRATLATIIQGVANNDFHVGVIAVDRRPHDQVRIHLLLRGEMASADLTFRPRRNLLAPTTGVSSRIKRTQELDGAVLDHLADLATPDEAIVIPRRKIVSTTLVAPDEQLISITLVIGTIQRRDRQAPRDQHQAIA